MNTPDRYDSIRKKLRPKRRWRKKLRPKRHWRQFSLPALLVVMTVATMAYVGWVQHRQYRAQQNEEEATAKWLHGRSLDSSYYRHREFPFPFWDVDETPKQDSPQCEILP